MTALCSVSDYRNAAKRRLPKAIFDHLDGGADSEGTVARNRFAYTRYALESRVRSESSEVDPSCELLGLRLPMPLVIAPTGGLKLFWPEGEAAVARAAADAGLPMALSAGASSSMEEIAAVSDGPKWLQICIYRDWDLVTALLERARHAGYSGLCVTLDGGLVGKRERDVRHRLGYSASFVLHNLFDLASHPRWSIGALKSLPFGFPNLPRGDKESLAAFVSNLTDPAPSWTQLARLRKEWEGPLILKAVAHPDDAMRAVAEGFDSIVVSNHGGRQFDSGLATLDMLPPIVAAVSDRIPVLVDGGIRRGLDVLKAIALGARACMIGRAHLWGLAARGERGVREVLEILRQEIRTAMYFSGVDRLSDLGRDRVRLVEGLGR